MPSTEPEHPAPPDQPPDESIAKPPRRKSGTRPRPSADGIAPPTVTVVDTQSRPAESSKELAARLKKDAEDAKHKRRLATITHCVFAGILSVVTLTCLAVVALARPNYPPETMKLMSTLLTAIVSGGASFFAGREAGKRD